MMTKASGGDLVGFHVIEVGKNFGVDLVYSYPEICDDERIVYLNKIMKMQREREKGRSGGASGGGGFDKVNRFLRFRHRWVYIHLSGRAESDNIMETTGVLLETKGFNPRKYSEVAEGLLSTYLKGGMATTQVLKVFLDLVVHGKSCVPGRDVVLRIQETCDDVDVPYTNCAREIIKCFGLETITIYTALTRKLRIVVFHHVAEDIYPYILSLPYLSPDESPLWNYYYPNVNLNDIELQHLKSLQGYVAGCSDTGMEKRIDLYDVFVNLPAREIIAAPHAKDKLSMTKAHKKMAVFLTQLADAEDVDVEDLHSHIIAKSKQLFKDGY